MNATLFLTSRGDFTATVNGRPAGAKTRSWLEFDRQDITGSLHTGENQVDVSVVTAVPADATPPADGLIPSALAGLVKIVGQDGRVDRYPTDARWEARATGAAAWAPSAAVAPVGDARFPDPGPLPGPAGLFRHDFAVSKRVARARLYVTALGSYRMFLNGARVGHDVLTPDFTDYRKRVSYQTYDVTSLVVPGANAIGAELGDGWFASAMSWYGDRFFFGPGPTRLLAQLEIDYTDGTRDRVVTNPSWKTSTSPIRHSEIYAGEMYDARLEQAGWSRAGFRDQSWTAATAAAGPAGAVSAQISAPVHIVQTLAPKNVKAMGGGVYVFDMGQNMVGWVRLSVNGPRGTRVHLRFAEILKPDGNIYRDNLRDADAADEYVLKGGGPETYQPSFTFHGFRYVEVRGYPGRPPLGAITGEVVSSLVGEPTGRLATSSPLINAFWNVGVWGQRGNFLSVPTDCPQRDERLGWMGDAGVFWRTGAYNFDIAAFTRKWLQDVDDAQSPDGAFTDTAPHVPDLGVGAPGWGDAGVIVPWTAWMQYGDTQFIRAHWDAMERWMAYIQAGNPDFIRKNRVGFDFSDWLAPDDRTSKPLVATAYWALIARQMAQMAQAVGNDEAATRYTALYGHIRSAFQQAFIKPDGTVERRHRDVVRARALHGDGARRAHAEARGSTRRRDPGARLARVNRIPRDAISALHARRPRAQRRGLPPVAQRHVSVVGLHGEERRDHMVGALERRQRRSGDELVQPLLVRVGRGVGLSRRDRHRHDRRRAGFQGHRHSSEARPARHAGPWRVRFDLREDRDRLAWHGGRAVYDECDDPRQHARDDLSAGDSERHGHRGRAACVRRRDRRDERRGARGLRNVYVRGALSDGLRAWRRIEVSFWVARRLTRKARGGRIPGVSDRRATPRGGMDRQPE